MRATDVILAELFGLKRLSQFDALEQVLKVYQLRTSRLLHQVGAANQVLGAGETESHCENTDLVDNRTKEIDQAVYRLVVFARRIFLYAHRLRRFGRRDMGRDSDVTGTSVALPTAGAADGCHSHCSKPDSIGAEQDELDRIESRLDAAVRPDLHPVAQPCLEKRPVGLLDTDLDRHADVSQSVLPGCSGSSVITADGNDVGMRLGDTSGNRTDKWNRGNLD